MKEEQKIRQKTGKQRKINDIRLVNFSLTIYNAMEKSIGSEYRITTQINEDAGAGERSRMEDEHETMMTTKLMLLTGVNETENGEQW